MKKNKKSENFYFIVCHRPLPESNEIGISSLIRDKLLRFCRNNRGCLRSFAVFWARGDKVPTKVTSRETEYESRGP